MFEGDLATLSTADLLESAAEWRAVGARADVRVLEVALVYADRFHPSACPARPGRRSWEGRERAVVLGGEGCPEVLEFAVAEFGVVLGVSPRVAANYLGQALGLRHRFPHTWARVLAGEATAWKACRIVADCVKLSEDAARYVDRRVAPLIDAITPYRLNKIVTAAKMHADPDAARAEAEEKARERGVFVARSDTHGNKTMYIRAAAGAVIRNEATLAAIAEALKTFGDTRPVQHRRADAVGIIADPRYTQELLTQARHHHTNTTTPDATVPDATTTAPGTFTPGGTAAGNTAPDATVPDATVPDATVPGTFTRGGTAPGNTAPDATVPGTFTPGGTAAGNTAPDPTGRDTFTPGGTAPNATAPDAPAPSTTGPGAIAPDATAPGTFAPGGTAPGANGPAATTADRRGRRGVNDDAHRAGNHGATPARAHPDHSGRGIDPAVAAAPGRNGADPGTRSSTRWDDQDPLDDPADEWTRDRCEPGPGDEADRDAPHPSVSDLPDPLDTPPPNVVEPFDASDPGLHLDLDDGDPLDVAARRALHARLAQIKHDAYTTHATRNGADRGGSPDRAGGRVRPGQTEIYVHLTDHTLAAGTGVLRAEGIGPLVADQLTDLIGHGPYTVKPVIDLNDAISVDAYEIPDRIRERVKLTHPVELFPFGTQETHHGMDLDHLRPYDPLGPPGQTSTTNLAPLGRYGHRVKTHAPGWTVHRINPTTLEWTTPHGFRYRVDPTGTHRVPKPTTDP